MTKEKQSPAEPNEGQNDHKKPQKPPAEHGGPPGPEPTRYGDWESGGKCVDF